MRLRYPEILFVTFIIPVLFLTACHYQGPPATLEAAVFAGDWEEVETAALEWARSPRFQRDATALRGYAALARGDTAAAIKHFLRARAGGPSRTDTHWPEALAARYPDRAIAQFLAGDSLARRGERHAGLKRFDAALALDPDLAVARVARGMLRALVGERATALQDLDALVADGPVAAEALVTRGLVHLEEGQQEKALADLKRALELAPEHAVAYNARGVIQARRGDWVAAMHDFETAFRLAPELVEARRNWQLAQAAGKRGAVLAAKRDIGSITMVVADKSGMNPATALASDAVRARTGQTPVVVTNIEEALSLSRSHHVVLQVPNGGFGAAAGIGF